MDKILDKIWRFFSSVKLAIVLILLIIATAIIGTVIQQGLPDEMYIQHYGTSTFNFLNSFDIFDMYHSWWFELLLMLFIVNVIVCTWDRLPAIFKMFSNPKLKLPIEKLNAFKEKETITYNGDRETLIKNLTQRLKEIYKSPIRDDSKEGDFLYLEKGRIARFGPYVTHISLIIIFVGVLIGSFWGFETFVNLVPGESTNIVRTLRGNKKITLPFSIRCNHFNVEFYNSGIPKAYKSDLSIMSDGNVVARKIIDVNKPLTYKGVTIYQASYGQAGASDFALVLSNAHKGENDISLNLNKPYHVTDDTAIAVLDYAQNYQGFGPTILVGVYKGEKLVNTSIYLQRYPDFHGAETVDGYRIRFVKADESYYTGLQVAKDPGAPYVAAGAIILIIGLLMSFFSYRRRIWIFIPDKFNRTFTVAGVADRNKYSFEIEFEKIVKEIKKGVI
jgi:cytochrome c biogenesis protein